ncbi:MAG: biotin/lipoyl-containing protein, partial [Actinomycetota bacterium]|nr:biotin/lipoyl-containing protein [Actinomycetota bacterium]
MADVTLPQLGETVTEGTITQWFKNVGDVVNADEPLFEVSTDKVDTEVPSPVSGVVTEIRAAEGDTIDVGVIVAVVANDGEAPAPAPEPATEPAPAPEPTPAPAPASAPAPVPAPAPAPAPASSAGENDARLLSPVVRRLVNEHGIDPSAVTGTGPGGRITREDILDHLDKVGSNTAPALAPASAPNPAAAPAPTAAPAPAPAATAPAVAGARQTVVPLSKIRQLTGDHMV